MNPFSSPMPTTAMIASLAMVSGLGGITGTTPAIVAIGVGVAVAGSTGVAVGEVGSTVGVRSGLAAMVGSVPGDTVWVSGAVPPPQATTTIKNPGNR